MFQISRNIGKIVAFDKSVTLVNALVLGNFFANIAKYHIMPKLDSLYYIFIEGSIGLSSNSLTSL